MHGLFWLLPRRFSKKHLTVSINSWQERARKNISITLIILLSIFSASCSKSPKTKVTIPSATSNVENTTTHESSAPVKTNKVSWDEITENGVDKNKLIHNVDKKKLTYIAEQLQNLIDSIDKLAKQDKEYWLKGRWLSDIKNSTQYKNVLSLGNEAIKPLYLIIYQSPNAYLYEYTCAIALDDITEHKTGDWATSKEFLELFTKRILKEKTH